MNKKKWIKVFESNAMPLVLILERFDENVHAELFSVVTVYSKHEEPKSHFYLENSNSSLEFDFDKIYSYVKDLVTKDSFIKDYYINDIELRDFIMDFMEHNNNDKEF